MISDRNGYSEAPAELADDPHYRGLLLFSDGRVAVLSDDGFAVALTDFCDHDDCPGAADRYLPKQRQVRI
ncbi:hypothetical protein [Nocardia sp. NPDC003963]